MWGGGSKSKMDGGSGESIPKEFRCHQRYLTKLSTFEPMSQNTQ